MKRLFLAIKFEVDDNFKEKLSALKSNFAAEKMKWVETENLHLTLRFFGETPEDRIPKIIKAVNSALKNQKQFSIESNQLGIFGSNYNPKVIWLGFKKEELIIKIQKQIVNELKSANYYPDRRNFVPHLTLARIKRLSDKKYFQNIINRYRYWEDFRFKIDNIQLLESKLHKSGPEYLVVEEFMLG